MTEKQFSLRHVRSVSLCEALWLSRVGLLLAISEALRLGMLLRIAQGLCVERVGYQTFRS